MNLTPDCYEYNWYALGTGTSTGYSIHGDEYRAGRNLLLAHADAYHLYDDVFRAEQRGAVGIVCNMDFGMPFNTEDYASVAAAQRSNEFWGGWFWDPIFFGQYPASMLDNVSRDRLQPLTEREGSRIRGTADVFFWNTYSANLIKDSPAPEPDQVGWWFDSRSSTVAVDAKGFTIGQPGASSWLHSVPEGVAAGLAWIQNRYSKPTPSAPGEGVRGGGIRLYPASNATSFTQLALIVTENGFDVPTEDVHTPEHLAVDDVLRWKDYFTPYLKNLHSAAATTGVTFAGYFAWALMDNLEWTHGFNTRFGLSYINFLDGRGQPITRGGESVHLQRVPKHSFKVLATLLEDF